MQKNIKPSTKGLTIKPNISPKRIHILLSGSSISALVIVIIKNITKKIRKKYAHASMPLTKK